MAAIIALYLVGVVMAYLAYEMAMTPPTNSKTKWCWRAGIVICGVIGLWLTIYQSKDATKKEEEFGKRLNDLQTNLLQDSETGKKELNARLDTVTARLAAIGILRQQYENLVQFVLTNKLISPEAKQIVIATDGKFQILNSQADDLNTWLSGLNGKLRDLRATDRLAHENQMEQIKNDYTQRFQCVNYAINSFSNMLGKVAMAKSDRMNFVLNGFPQTVDPETSGSTNTERYAGKAKLEKNAGWDFDVILAANGPELFINGKDSSFTMNVGDGHGVVFIPDHTFDFHFPSENCKTLIAEYLGFIIANQEEKTANTNR